ncbi:c-type cytochrome [Roseobacter sp. EG26]|uniref:c-type cytochrome n=1 Tax=Roseobacter sp. EG26 TaxID=3412477 RepID=UPI00262187FF|nr:hypothetical protein [uncultured Roseobacter sp.]
MMFFAASGRAAHLALATIVCVAGTASGQNDPEDDVDAGDVEYGAYLATECVACHTQNSGATEIPSITGRRPEDFIGLLEEYRSGTRVNPVMQTITARLGREEMRALAAYFKGAD